MIPQFGIRFLKIPFRVSIQNDKWKSCIASTNTIGFWYHELSDPIYVAPAGKVSDINMNRVHEKEDEKSVDNMIHSLFMDICCSRYRQTDKLVVFPIRILIEYRQILPNVTKRKGVALP